MKQFRKEFIERNMEVLEFLKEYKNHCEKEMLLEVGGLDFETIFPTARDLYNFYPEEYIVFVKALYKNLGFYSMNSSIQKTYEEELIIKNYYELMKGKKMEKEWKQKFDASISVECVDCEEEFEFLFSSNNITDDDIQKAWENEDHIC